LFSDARGEFACAGLDAGKYQVRLVPDEPSRADPVGVIVSASSPSHLVIRTRAAGALRVQITNARNFDMAAMVVLAKPEQGDTLVGRHEGESFVFESIPLGGYEVSSEFDRTAKARAQLTRDGQIVELSLQLSSPGRIEGQIVDETGQGVPDLWVRASAESDYSPSPPVTPILSDGAGAFSLPGLTPGRYTIQVSGEAGEAELNGIESNSRQVRLRLSPRILTPEDPARVVTSHAKEEQ